MIRTTARSLAIFVSLELTVCLFTKPGLAQTASASHSPDGLFDSAKQLLVDPSPIDTERPPKYQAPPKYKEPAPYQLSVDERPVESRWYGLPLIPADAYMLALIVAGRVAGSQEIVTVGVAFAVIDGMLLHVGVNRGRDLWLGLGKGLLSAALRGGLGGAACALLGHGCNNLETPALVRLTLGILVGSLLDIVFLSHRDVEVTPTSEALQIAPWVERTSIGLRVGRTFSF